LTVGERSSRKSKRLEARGQGADESYSPKFLWRDNLGLAIGLVSVTFIAGRLLGVAAGDPETAYAILQAEGTGAIIVGSLISMVGLIAAPVFIFTSYYGGALTKTGTSHLMIPAIAAICGISAIIVAFTAPAENLIISSVVALGAIAYFRIVLRISERKRPKKTTPRPTLSSSLPSLLAVYTIGVLGASTLSSIPWLPEQNLLIQGHNEFSAYILSETSNVTLILTHDPTGVIREPSRNITSIEPCRASDYLIRQGTLNQWLHSFMSADKIADYPRCLSGSIVVRH
jgi:hypothetical protein